MNNAGTCRLFQNVRRPLGQSPLPRRTAHQTRNALTAVLSVALVLGAAGCGGGSKSGSNTVSPTTGTTGTTGTTTPTGGGVPVATSTPVATASPVPVSTPAPTDPAADPGNSVASDDWATTGELSDDPGEDDGDGDDGRLVGSTRRGAHLLALSRFSSTSMDRLTGVLAADASPSNVEFTFVPFWNSSDPFGNAKTLIDARLAKRKTVTVAVYLSFHAGESNSGSTDTSPNDLTKRVKERAKKFSDEMLAAYGSNSRVIFKLSPSLEDEWSDRNDPGRFTTLASVMAGQLDWTKVQHLQLRRSSTEAYTLKSSLKVTRKKSDGRQQSRTFTLQHESHGYVEQAKSFQAYSNDGVFVYLDNPTSATWTESADSAANSTAFASAPKLSLTDFLTAVRTNARDRSSKVSAFLLWRPAYNIWPRTPSGLTPGSPDSIHYNKEGKAWEDSRSDTNADGNGDMFSETEAAVLRRFLGI